MGSVWQNMETEISTYWLVKFAKHRGSWAPFEMNELLAFYRETFPDERSFHFNKLMRDNYIQSIASDTVAFTVEFVGACYAVSPAIKE